MLVTVMTDASWCPETGATGYGYWVISERCARGGGNTIRTACANANEAEMLAVVNAVHVALRAGAAHLGDDILVQTDSEHAIRRFQNHIAAASNTEKMAVGALDKLKQEHSLKVRFRHVKGHTRNPAARSVANRRCDERAKQHMRRMRQQIQGGFQ